MADWLTRFGRVGGSTASGALAGTAFGPVGTLVGGAAGLVGGLFSDSAANEADVAAENSDALARAARERNRQYIDQLMGDIRGQQNPYGEQALAKQYSQIARNYAGAGSNLNASLAARGLAGQAQGDAMRANLDAAQANAVTAAQADNTVRASDWSRGQQQALMQLQGLSQQADQADMAAAAQMAQMRSNAAQQAQAGLNSTISGMATIGALKGDYGRGIEDWKNMDWGGYGQKIQDAWGGVSGAAGNAANGVWNGLSGAADGVRSFDWGGLMGKKPQGAPVPLYSTPGRDRNLGGTSYNGGVY